MPLAPYDRAMLDAHSLSAVADLVYAAGTDCIRFRYTLNTAQRIAVYRYILLREYSVLLLFFPDIDVQRRISEA